MPFYLTGRQRRAVRSEFEERELELLIADRRKIFATLSRLHLCDNDSEDKQQQIIHERRRLKTKLTAINVAIKAAGGKIQGGKAFFRSPLNT